MPDDFEILTVDDSPAAVNTATGEVVDPADLAGWVWEALEPPVRRERLAELRRWVQWLVRNYPFAQTHITPCWYAHRDVREHLTALFVSWVRVYTPGPKRDTAEVDWIDAMYRTLPRLTLKECSPSKHIPPVERELKDSDRTFEVHIKIADEMVAPAHHPGLHEMIRQGVGE